MHTPSTIEPDAEPFSRDAHEVVRGLRGAFSELLLSVGADPHTPQSISSHLGLNKNLAWKISKIIQAEDPASALEQMPGPPGIRILIKGIEKAGAGPPLVQTARDAIREYERLIKIHSGDRATLEMMGSELATHGRQTRDEHHRKLLFQGASYVWGAQTKALLKLGVLVPGASESVLDFATVNAFYDFRRLRPDVTWIMSRREISNDDDESPRSFLSEAIDPGFEGAKTPPLMGDFCSDPLPRLRRIEDPRATTFELTPGRVGNTGALTCVAGTIHRNLPRFRTSDNEWGSLSARCEAPSELLIVDILFHKDFGFAQPPTTELQSDVSGLGNNHTKPLLPLNEQLIDLGISRNPPPTPDIPRYRPLLESVLKRMGCAFDEFQAYRIKIAYPAYPTSLQLRYKLPERR